MRPQFFVSESILEDLSNQANKVGHSQPSIQLSSAMVKGLLADLSTLKLRLQRYDSTIGILLPGVNPDDYDKAVAVLKSTIDQACQWPDEMYAKHWQSREMHRVWFNDDTGDWEIDQHAYGRKVED